MDKLYCINVCGIYSLSNCFSILLETPRALTSHDFIVRAIPSCIAFICLVIVAELLSGHLELDSLYFLE